MFIPTSGKWSKLTGWKLKPPTNHRHCGCEQLDCGKPHVQRCPLLGREESVNFGCISPIQSLVAFCAACPKKPRWGRPPVLWEDLSCTTRVSVRDQRWSLSQKCWAKLGQAFLYVTSHGSVPLVDSQSIKAPRKFLEAWNPFNHRQGLANHFHQDRWSQNPNRSSETSGAQ